MLRLSLFKPATVVTLQISPRGRFFQCAPARSHFADRSTLIRLAPIIRQVGVALLAAGTVMFTANTVKPVFLNSEPVVERVLSATYLDTADMRAPWLQLPERLA